MRRAVAGRRAADDVCRPVVPPIQPCWSCPTALGTVDARLCEGSAWSWIAGFTVGVSSLLAFIGWLMPMTDNLLCDFGMGTRSLAARPDACAGAGLGHGDRPLAVLGAAQAYCWSRPCWHENSWLGGRATDMVPKVPWHVVVLVRR